MQSARRVPALIKAAAPARRMGGGHAHAVPKPQIPPRPELPSNASFGQRIEHELWYKRDLRFSGVESYVRYYLPENHHIVLSILGLYAGIGLYMSVSNKAKARTALSNMPQPTQKPDYRSPIAKSSDIPDFGTPEWEKFVQQDNGPSFEKWLVNTDK